MSSHQESRSPIPSTLFRPGEGARPPFLAGRAAEQRILAGAAEELDEKDERGRANVSQNVVLYGPRGNGKTALTLWLQDFAAADPRGWMPVRINAGEGGDDPDALARLLAPEPWRKQVMERGWSASALGFGLSLPARPDGGWSVAQALASRSARAPSLVVIDEAHMLGAQAARLLLNASHELRGAGAPLLLVLAGTPELEDALRSARVSHWERGRRIPVGRLDAESAPSALLEPLKEHGASMTEGALEVAMREALGYPFFLQLFGRHLVEAMNEAESGQADEAIADRAAKAFRADREKFYKGRRNELRLTGGALPAAAAWGAIRGFGEGASCDLVLTAMEPHCDDVHDVWHRLQRSGMLWEKAEGVEAGIPSLLDSVVRSAGPPADAAYRAGFAIGREWAQWSAASAGAEQR